MTIIFLSHICCILAIKIDKAILNCILHNTYWKEFHLLKIIILKWEVYKYEDRDINIS